MRRMKEKMKGEQNDGEGQEKMTDGVERETERLLCSVNETVNSYVSCLVEF